MEKTGLMIEFEEETGGYAIVTVKVGFAELQFPSEVYAEWLETELLKASVKATAYDRLMSGEYTLKDIANIFQMYSAIDSDGYACLFADPPFIEGKSWSSNFPEEEFSFPGVINHTGDWKDSLTLPDGWEESNAR